MVDEAGGGDGETEEQTELDDDQHHGEDDAGQGDGQPDLVVCQVALRQRRHVLPLPL